MEPNQKKCIVLFKCAISGLWYSRMNQTKEVGEVYCETCETGISPQNEEYFKSYEIGDWRDKHDLKKVEPESCCPINFDVDRYVQKMKSQYYTFNTKYKSI